MTRILELIVAGAIGAAMPTAAAVYFAKTPEIYMDAPQISMCGSSSDPCHIILAEPARVSVDDAVRVSVDDTVAISVADPVEMKLNCGGAIDPTCEVKVKQDLTSPLIMQLIR